MNKQRKTIARGLLASLVLGGAAAALYRENAGLKDQDVSSFTEQERTTIANLMNNELPNLRQFGTNMSDYWNAQIESISRVRQTLRQQFNAEQVCEIEFLLTNLENGAIRSSAVEDARRAQ